MSALQFVFNRLMVVWLIVCAIVAYVFPQPFKFMGSWTLWLLGAVIFFMGLTLQWEDLGRVFSKPRALLTGIISKWIVVPLVAYVAALVAFNSITHQPQLAAGVILDGSTPSGVSANLFTFLGGGNVALSVSMSAINTVISPVLTPIATSSLAGRFVSVDPKAMFLQMIQVVLVPVILGLLLHTFFRKPVDRVRPVLPILSAIALYLIVLALVSGAAVPIKQHLSLLPLVIVVTCIQIIVTLALGYGIGAALKLPRRDRLAIMFEIGIYNSGLGATLAAKDIGAFAALPPLANTIFNLIIGALVAAYLANKIATRPQEAPAGAVARTAPSPTAR